MKYKDFFRNRTGRCRLALSILLQFIRIFKLSHGLEHYLQSKIYYVYFSFISGIKTQKEKPAYSLKYLTPQQYRETYIRYGVIIKPEAA